MIDKQLFKAAYVAAGRTQAQAASDLGMTPSRLRRLVNSGELGVEKARVAIELWNIKEPDPIFFAKTVS